MRKLGSTRTDQLDGLRFFAFLAVMFFHFRYNVSPKHATVLRFETLGWVGVEVFFALSAFLLFSGLEQEHKRFGSISISKFYGRRVLRLYPLMIAFPLLMLLVGGAQNDHWGEWYAGIATCTANFMLWVPGIGNSIPSTTHLWSLAYEFQIYLVLPLLFMTYRAVGKTAFVAGLMTVVPICLAARAAFHWAGLAGMAVHGTPFLRPEPTLLGIAIAIGAFGTIPIVTMWCAFIASSAALLFSPELGWNVGGVWVYIPSAAFSGSLLYLALYSKSLASLLRLKPLAWLGQISFGLYIFHPWALDLGRAVVLGPLNNYSIGLTGRFLISLAICIAISALSFYTFEMIFNKMKPRSGDASRQSRDLAQQQLAPAK